MLTRRIAAYFVLPPCFSPLVLFVSTPFLLLQSFILFSATLLSSPLLLASFVRYVQSGIWLSVVKRVYSCLKVLNLKLYLFVTVGRKFAALVCLRLRSPSHHYTRNLIKALFAPRVLISALRNCVSDHN